MKDIYECIIIGGGIAGLQAAIQLGRYKHDILVIDSNYGRSTLCKNYHNILGWPDGVSGETLRELGRNHAEKYGVHFSKDKVIKCTEQDGSIMIETATGKLYQTKTILLATGVMDRLPDIPNIKSCLGLTIYVCPDCDGYEVSDKSVLVLGAGKAGANMALTLTYWTKDIVYINHEEPDIEDPLKEKLVHSNIAYKHEPIREVLAEDGSIFKGVKLENGETLYADRGFIAFGGNKVYSDLAEQLGVKLMENRHVQVDPRTKETSVSNVWAAGDIVAHSEQSTIAMGEGAQAAIWIHKRLLGQK
ncbi:MAG TPA: NAD(P)/FAD-dependent oxidoreductase [Bacillus sp. (in: firmicutes)]|nr:NAD(P)/FAD-dependent oxidoreductase [Bacillus sp. (in: firmicutes)]